jgi:hypothetical protein
VSEIEDPVTTVVTLLSENMQIEANIQVCREWPDQEALQNVDGQVTVGLAECADNKLTLSGKLRRRVSAIRVNVWSKNLQIRQKMVEEVLRVVRQNRKNPGGNLAYLDVVSFRDADRVDVKPFILRTELILKSWMFENVEDAS